MPGNDFNQFINNFQQFILIEHHFIVGVTNATLPFIGAFWVSFSLAFIMIATRFEHPFAGEEYGVANRVIIIINTKENMTQYAPMNGSVA